MSSLNYLINKLGEGEIRKTKEGKIIFKLSSYEANPIVKPQDIGLYWYENKKLKIGAVFNPGAEIFQEKVILLPRSHKNYQQKKYFDKEKGIERYYLENYISEIWPLISEDGVKFKRLENIVIRGDGSTHKDFTYGIEDIRIIRHNSKYLLIGCGKVAPPFIGKDADRCAIYSTDDFLNITYHGIIPNLNTRNVIPFFCKDELYILFRFYPDIQLVKIEGGIEQLLNPNKYTNYWQRIYENKDKYLFIKVGEYPHEEEKIGPSTPLIKTDKGWLFLYHGVGKIGIDITREYGLKEELIRAYSISAAILDLDNPKKILCRTRYPIYIPSHPWELTGNVEYEVDVPFVIFPVGAIVKENKLLLYCGAADKYIVLLSCHLDNLIEYLFKNCAL